MKTIRIILLYFTIVIGAVFILLSLLSLIHDLKYWYSKVLDFPRVQYLVVGLCCLLAFFLFNKKWNVYGSFLVLGLLVSIYIQLSHIGPYWFGEKTVPDAVKTEKERRQSVSILLANVLIKNRESQKLLEIIEDSNPDIVLLMEVDQWWIQEVQNLKNEYKYSIEYPLNNAYGMALYSRLPLKEKEVKFFQHEDVPSFHVQVSLNNEKSFNFHGVHPVAPVPSSKYPDNVGRKEVALLRTAEMVAKVPLPAIVAGDFNDVSWSNTSRLFEDTGNLHNVRIGRGLYNSFDAKSKILRWPLDHYFVTNELFLLDLKRLPAFGSDHFPMYAEFIIR